MPFPMQAPMTPPMPPMNGQPGGQSKGKFDPIRTVFEGPAQILGQLLSQDLVQAKQAGAPTDHLFTTLANLLQMSPLGKVGGAATLSMGGGGGQNGSPNNQNGGGMPPQGPNPSVGRPQDQGQQMATQVQDPTSSQPQGQAQAQPQGPQVNSQPSNGFFDPGAFDPSTNTVRMPGAFMSGWGMDRIAKQQALLGMRPYQQGDVAQKVAEAKQVPLTQAQEVEKGFKERELQAGGFSAQATALNEQLQRMDADQKSLEDQMKTYATTRGWKNKTFGGSSKEMEDTQKKINSLMGAKAKIHQRLANLYGQQPNFKAGSYSAGETRDIDGVTYKRKANGEWHPQS